MACVWGFLGEASGGDQHMKDWASLVRCGGQMVAVVHSLPATLCY